jgi:hypothetical protein
MDSRCPICKHVSPLCKRRIHQLITTMRNDLETTNLKQRVATLGQKHQILQ